MSTTRMYEPEASRIVGVSEQLLNESQKKRDSKVNFYISSNQASRDDLYNCGRQ